VLQQTEYWLCPWSLLLKLIASCLEFLNALLKYTAWSLVVMIKNTTTLLKRMFLGLAHYTYSQKLFCIYCLDDHYWTQVRFGKAYQNCSFSNNCLWKANSGVRLYINPRAPGLQSCLWVCLAFLLQINIMDLSSQRKRKITYAENTRFWTDLP